VPLLEGFVLESVIGILRRVCQCGELRGVKEQKVGVEETLHRRTI
jgi:hypothetical protein